jgi:hypothetical protein
MNNLTRIAVAALVLAPSGGFAQTLSPSQDAYYVAGNATNTGTATTITVGQSGAVGLVQFDLTQLPSVTASQIQKATLTLFLDHVGSAGTINVDTVSASTPWTELTVNGNSGISAGSAVATSVATATAASFISMDATAAVQGWITTPSSNNGFMILGNGGTSVQFDSKENTTTSHPAMLTIVLVSVGPTGPTGAASSVPGPTGPTGAASAVAGPTGPTGTSGPNGATGPTGSAGTNGTNGATGPTGSNGTSGPNGATGPTGSNGTNGTNGATGPTGSNGTNGTNGATGPTGSNGTNGTNGATGPTGSNGTNGTNGATGPTGSNGTNGTNGATGPTGSAGATGPTGSNGATGPTGSAGSNGTNGTNGSNGTNGAAGATGPAGAGTITLQTVRDIPASAGFSAGAVYTGFGQGLNSSALTSPGCSNTIAQPCVYSVIPPSCSTLTNLQVHTIGNIGQTITWSIVTGSAGAVPGTTAALGCLAQTTTSSFSCNSGAATLSVSGGGTLSLQLVLSAAQATALSFYATVDCH